MSTNIWKKVGVFKEYRTTEISGKKIEYSIDRENGIHKIQNSCLFIYNDNYKLIKIGDTISKVNGVKLLKPDFDCVK